jgi:hypothetical protein
MLCVCYRLHIYVSAEVVLYTYMHAYIHTYIHTEEVVAMLRSYKLAL